MSEFSLHFEVGLKDDGHIYYTGTLIISDDNPCQTWSAELFLQHVSDKEVRYPIEIPPQPLVATTSDEATSQAYYWLTTVLLSIFGSNRPPETILVRPADWEQTEH